MPCPQHHRLEASSRPQHRRSAERGRSSFLAASSLLGSYFYASLTSVGWQPRHVGPRHGCGNHSQKPNELEGTRNFNRSIFDDRKGTRPPDLGVAGVAAIEVDEAERRTEVDRSLRDDIGQVGRRAHVEFLQPGEEQGAEPGAAGRPAGRNRPARGGRPAPAATRRGPAPRARPASSRGCRRRTPARNAAPEHGGSNRVASPAPERSGRRGRPRRSAFAPSPASRLRCRCHRSARRG